MAVTLFGLAVCIRASGLKRYLSSFPFLFQSFLPPQRFISSFNRTAKSLSRESSSPPSMAKFCPQFPVIRTFVLDLPFNLFPLIRTLGGVFKEASTYCEVRKNLPLKASTQLTSSATSSLPRGSYLFAEPTDSFLYFFLI